MCRYFRLGKCTRGESCPFSHDLSHPDSFICPYFLEGFCKYGTRCQYDHKYPEVSQPSEPITSKWPRASRIDPSHSEASALSVESAPWRPSGAFSNRPADEVISSRRPLKLSTSAAPFTADHKLSTTARNENDKRPVCVYFQTGACQFGEKCRFKHVISDDPESTAAVVAAAEHATRTAINLKNLEMLPACKQKPHVLASLNWSHACSKPATDMVQVAPVKHKSAWGNSLLVNKNPAGFPQTLPEASSPQQPHGWKIVDSNVDLLDPWERSQNPSTIPLRPPPEDSDAAQDALTFEAEEDAAEMIPDPSEMLCTEHTLTGYCSVADTCLCMHGKQCSCCGYFCLHPTDLDAQAAHETACYAMHEEAQRLEIMQTMECGICLEPVLFKEEPSERCFGLMECEHCFCLPCIRNWRNNNFADVDSATRTCPECRKKTHFVTPSPVWPATEEEKDVIIEDYKQQLQDKDCKHFDSGNGTCPFGTSCFYRHEYLDGSLQDRTQLPDVRFVTNSDGEFTTVQDNTLAGLIDTARSSRPRRSQR